MHFIAHIGQSDNCRFRHFGFLLSGGFGCLFYNGFFDSFLLEVSFRSHDVLVLNEFNDGVSRCFSCVLLFIGNFLCECIFLVDGIEVDPIIDHHRLELSKRFVHKIAHALLRRESDFLTSVDQDTLTRVHVHAFTRVDAGHLERAQALHLQRLIIVQAIVHHLGHCGQETFGCTLADAVLPC